MQLMHSKIKRLSEFKGPSADTSQASVGAELHKITSDLRCQKHKTLIPVFSFNFLIKCW